LERKGIEYTILTDQKRAAFLSLNNIQDPCIVPKFHGISYVYKKKGNDKQLNIPFTTAKLLIDTPYYIIDYSRMIAMALKEKYDLIINDINLQMTRLPRYPILNIVHYSVPKRHDIKRVFRNGKSFAYEGFLEPLINIPLLFTRKFIMDLRCSYLDYVHIFPPIVSRVTKDKEIIRKELQLRRGDRLIVDGRSNPPVSIYEQIAMNHPEIKIVLRTDTATHENIYVSKLIPSLVDYVNAADLFITNPGFSSLGEGAIYGTRMLLEDPGNHLEQVKNHWIAIQEGYANPITNLARDIFKSLDDTCSHPRLPNGLDFLSKKIVEYAE